PHSARLGSAHPACRRSCSNLHMVSRACRFAQKRRALVSRMTKESQAPTIVPVLLSGGSGTRLLPGSRALHPKQLLPMGGELSMLQETARRFAGVSGYDPPLIVCNDEHRFTIAAQLQATGIVPQVILLEPVGRNTAPAAAVAALTIKDSTPGA